MEIQHLTRQLLVFKEGIAAPVHGSQRGQIRCRHVELLTEMAPQDSGHDAHGIKDSATHAQEADLQGQSQLQGGPPLLLGEKLEVAAMFIEKSYRESLHQNQVHPGWWRAAK